MLFNSMAFAIFLPIVFILYWVCPVRYRYLFLIGASYYFYMCMDIRYAALLLFTTAVSYGLALGMEHSGSTRLRNFLFGTGIALLSAPLLLFKYSPILFSMLPFTIQFMLPVGISFYTFQTLGYLIDI